MRSPRAIVVLVSLLFTLSTLVDALPAPREPTRLRRAIDVDDAAAARPAPSSVSVADHLESDPSTDIDSNLEHDHLVKHDEDTPSSPSPSHHASSPSSSPASKTDPSDPTAEEGFMTAGYFTGWTADLFPPSKIDFTQYDLIYYGPFPLSSLSPVHAI
jgi:hypothetical protein